ncbi:MAG: hypothetical protein VX237_09025, partial [Chloroflexota bacterium]|nr:hypothetical protein [Chloroflexota bacterium]
ILSKHNNTHDIYNSTHKQYSGLFDEYLWICDMAISNLNVAYKETASPTNTTRPRKKTPTKGPTAIATTPVQTQTRAQRGIALDGWKFTSQPQFVIDAFTSKYGDNAGEMWANERNMFMGYIP